jgi:hypothetical protein
MQTSSFRSEDKIPHLNLKRFHENTFQVPLVKKTFSKIRGCSFWLILQGQNLPLNLRRKSQGRKGINLSNIELVIPIDFSIP